MSAVKFTFDTHFESGAARADAERRSRKSYSAEEIASIREQGRTDGFKSGEVLAQQAMAAALAQLSGAVMRAIEMMDTDVEAMRAEAANLAFACARKLAGAALAAAPESEIVSVLRLAMHEAIAEPRIVVKTTPALADEIRRRAAEVAQDEGYDGRIQFAPDGELSGADCRIEWKGGGMEKSLAAIETHLSELIRRRFARAPEMKE
jgi:flagellar assembly protein FliH